MVLMAAAGDDEAGPGNVRVDRRKVRLKTGNDTHPIYKTRIKKVLEYMAASGSGKYRSVQDVRSETGVSYIFIVSLVGLGLLVQAGDEQVRNGPGGGPRRYVMISEKGRQMHNLILDIDEVMLAFQK